MVLQFDCPEGATPINDTSGLIPRGVITQEDLNRVEAENIFEAQKKYLNGKIDNPIKWFNIETLKLIHGAMFDRVWTWAGMFRKAEIEPVGVKPHLIAVCLEQLSRDVHFWCAEPELTFLEQAARVHHRLVFIHPFSNGNGRFSRLVADRYLLAYGCSHAHWPYLQDPKNNVRAIYIQALKAADGGEYTLLIDFMRAYGARDPYLSEFLGFSSYRQQFSGAKRFAMVKAMLRTKCEVNETYNNGHHPLHIALQNSDEEIALLLIQHGADIRRRGVSGLDPFGSAINKGMFKVANALCKAGYFYKPGMLLDIKIRSDKLYQFDLGYFGKG